MDTDQALASFAALSQPTRLDVFRLLVAHEPKGLPAGEVARQLDVPHNTLSSHFGILVHSGLIEAERQSRQIIYRVRLTSARELAAFILKDCCGGRPEVCVPLVADLDPCCPAGSTAAKEASHA